MPYAAQSVDLSALDDARPAALDPAVFTRNLIALRDANPTLADRVEAASLSDEWRAVHALDDFVTYRLESPGAPPEWLAATAMPRNRAESLVATYELGQMNATMPALGSGAELLLLLASLPQHVAVFVFEPDLRVVAAVLRCHDLSAALRQWRCIFVPPSEERDFVLGLLEREPGLLPPGNIARLFELSSERVLHVRDLCQSMVTDSNQVRARQQAAVDQRLARLDSTCTDPPRLAILGLPADSRVHRAAGNLRQAAAELGWPALARTTALPRDANMLAHNQRLAEFGPSAMICVGSGARRLPEPLRGRAWTWYLRVADVPAELEPGAAGHLAATPGISDALHRSGVPADAIQPFYCACDPTSCVAEMPIELSDKIVLVGDLPNDDADAWGVVQPTHKLIWQALRRLARECWERDVILRPPVLLERAGRAANMPVSDESVRDQFLRLIERVIVPAATLEMLARGLLAESGSLSAVGRGWPRLATSRLRHLAPDMGELAERGMPAAPLTAIFAGSGDPLSFDLLDAGARGWPIMLHTPSGPAFLTRLGGVLAPRQHITTFATLSQLRDTLKAAQADRTQTLHRALRAADHLRNEHSMQHRLQTLAPLL